MVSTRSQKGQSTSNATSRKVSSPATKKNKKDKEPSRKRVRLASPETKAAEQTPVGDGPAKPGLRELLLGLPIELFGEICSFLDAIELRRLSLTDRTFWSVLVSAKSNGIWRQAFKRVAPPMPECPETMSGPDYAQFMLLDACTICKAYLWQHSIDYFHRVRYCDACRQRNILSKKLVLNSYPDFPLDFLKYLSSEAVSSDGSSLTGSQGSKRLYHKVTIAEVYNLWKSLSEKADTHEAANARLIERLEKYADNRIKSGLKMKDWHKDVRDQKFAQSTKLRNDRNDAIIAKLVELGHEPRDVPLYHFILNDLVELTDQEWERIGLTLIRATESNKANRLYGQSMRRRNERTRALQSLWNGIVATASGTRAVYIPERNACPYFNQFWHLPPVAALLSADTDGIPPEQLNAVRPEGLQFAIQGRRSYLVRFHNIHKGLPVDQINEEEWSSLSNEETIAKLDVIAAELAQAVNGFWDSTRKVVDWYPSLSLGAVDSGVLSSAEGLAPGLIARMLESLGRDHTTEAGVVTSGSWSRKTILYRCTRCDERLAPYLTFPEMITHFLEKKAWFDKASAAREKAFIEPSGSKDPPSHSTFVNDHDWNTEGDVIASDNPHEKGRITKAQNQLEAAYGNDPEDYDGEYFTNRSRRSANQAPRRRTRRICRLCPEGFSPKPMYFATLKIHIEHIHCKQANVEEDTAAFDRSRHIVPANPWIFDVPFVPL
ncbi:hypothetical protein FS837_005799 [Tulasnella sp. UAMH 9824]|nr:hypothetical protein FS837_005799 [Tulasnella sp. UAMH 9824]